MRTIKFRAKTPKGKWLYGMPTYEFEYIFNEIIIDSLDNYEIIASTVGQFTGLFDKNGVEIYEGDIINANPDAFINEIEDYYTCEWNNTGQFVLINKTMRHPCNMHGIEKMEVIGNIHDNPELLKIEH